MGSVRTTAGFAGSFLLGALVIVACSAPDDVAPPPPPVDDAGVDTGIVVADCTGVSDGTACTGAEGATVCANGVCIKPSCGDGVVTAPEECDLGTANAIGGGCEPDCRFTCTASDPARNCPSSNACIANGACDPDKHTCTPGAPLAAGATCGSYKLCVGGDCVAGTCGDAIVTAPNEDCDNGTANGPGQGCESTCKFTCANAATDCPASECNTVSCSTVHLCAQTPNVAKNGQACTGATAGYTCSNGACVAPGAVCGNGVKEGGEDCDFGTANNGPNTGCEANCKYSCAGNSCVDMNACHAAPTCTANTGPAGGGGFKCVTGATKADGAVCGAGSICLTGVCKASTCGDGFRDPAKSEDCDDGNTTKLDACDDKCKFEQDQRVIAMKMIFDTSKCANNATGAAVKGAAQKTMQDNIDSGIADGSLSALFKIVGPNLTGANGAVTVGSISGIVVTAAGYAGSADTDWWYHPDPLTIDGARDATAMMTGNYAGSALDAAGRLNLSMNIGGSQTLLKVSSGHLVGAIGAVSTPLVSAGATPGHVAAEHLNGALQSYGAMGGTKAAITGSMCGDISAASLATTSLPASLTSGILKCKEGYNANNRMLDVFINGCTVILAGNVIVKTQPDQVDPGATPAGGGGPYTFAIDANKRVTSCKDKNGAAVATLQSCLNAAAYSSSFTFATDRVIIK